VARGSLYSLRRGVLFVVVSCKGWSSLLVMAVASGFPPRKACLSSDLGQEAVQLALPSWELLSLWLEGVEGIHRVWFLVQGGGESFAHVQYLGYSQSELVDGLGVGCGLQEGLVPEVVPL